MLLFPFFKNLLCYHNVFITLWKKQFRSNFLLYYMMENTIIKTSKYIKNFVCEKCDFRCSKKGDYNRHLKSKKHNTTTTTKIQQKILHSCKCGKSYNHRASLFNHKKSCTYTEGHIIDSQ